MKGELTTKPLEVIESSGILAGEDVLKLKEMMPAIQENFDTVQVFRTPTEASVSILNPTKFPTSGLKFHQARREMDVHAKNLAAVSYDTLVEDVEFEVKEYTMRSFFHWAYYKLNPVHPLKRKMVERELERHNFVTTLKEREAKHRVREIAMWKEIQDQEGEGLTNEEKLNVDSVQLLGYTKRWIRQKITAGDSGSPAERWNLEGQLISGIMECERRGIIDEEMREEMKQIDFSKLTVS